MAESIDAEGEFRQLELRIADASRTLMELENTVGLMQAVGGDVATADRAALAAFHALAVMTRRRAELLRRLGR